MKEKAAALAVRFSLGQQGLHHGQAALLQLLLALNIPCQVAEQGIEIDGGAQGVGQDRALEQRVALLIRQLGQQGCELLVEALQNLGWKGVQGGQLSVADAGIGDLAKAVLPLHAPGGQSGQVEPFAGWVCRAGKGPLHQGVHPAQTGMLAVGEYAKTALQPCGGSDVGRWHHPGKGIEHQRHANPIEVLHHQPVRLVPQFFLQGLEAQVGHGRTLARRSTRMLSRICSVKA